MHCDLVVHSQVHGSEKRMQVVIVRPVLQNPARDSYSAMIGLSRQQISSLLPSGSSKKNA
jgi:hypothetical protein